MRKVARIQPVGNLSLALPRRSARPKLSQGYHVTRMSAKIAMGCDWELGAKHWSRTSSCLLSTQLPHWKLLWSCARQGGSHMIRLLMTLLATFLLIGSAAGATIHVDWTGAGDHLKIQEGLDAASPGDTVLVAPGTYVEWDIEMRGGVVLSGDGPSPNAVVVSASGVSRVFSCKGLSQPCSISNLTITEGVADPSGMHGSPQNCGGGVYCCDCELTLSECVLAGNEAWWGGGVFAGASCSVAIDGCLFMSNSAVIGGGGAIALEDCTASIDECVLEGNSGHLSAGALRCKSSSPTMRHCLIVDNSANGDGGGIACYAGSSPSVTSCTFAGNYSFSFGIPEAGGSSLYCSGGSSPTLSHCILAFGQSTQAVGCYDAESQPALECCDVYGNPEGNWVGCIADQYGISGNISADPCFCDCDNGDYTVSEESPCAPSNNACGELIGALDVGCGASAIEVTTWGHLKALFR